MKTLYGMLLGFMIIPSTLSLIGLFAYASCKLGISHADAVMGAALFGMLLIAALAVAAKLTS